MAVQTLTIVERGYGWRVLIVNYDPEAEAVWGFARNFDQTWSDASLRGANVGITERTKTLHFEAVTGPEAEALMREAQAEVPEVRVLEIPPLKIDLPHLPEYAHLERRELELRVLTGAIIWHAARDIVRELVAKWDRRDARRG